MRDHLVSIGILPNVNSIKLNRDAKQGTSVSSFTTRSKNKQIKSRQRATHSHKGRESDDKNAVATCEKTVPQLGCVSQDSEPLEEYDSPSLRYVKQVFGKTKGPSLGKIPVKISRQRSLHAKKFEDRSQEETERQERCARGKAWNIANIFFSSRKGQSYILFAYQLSGICRPHPP